MYRNFTAYTPEDAFRKHLQSTFNIEFYKDDQGQDWYDIQKELDDTLFTVFCDRDGLVVSVSKDPSSIPAIPGGFCFQVDIFEYKPGQTFYDIKSSSFINKPRNKSLDTLLKELKLLEIKSEFEDIYKEDILSKKEEIRQKLTGIK